MRKRDRKKGGFWLLPAILLVTIALWQVEHRESDTMMNLLKNQMSSALYESAVETCMPGVLHYNETDSSAGNQTVFSGAFWNLFPVNFFLREQESYETQVESTLDYEEILKQEARDENYIDEETGTLIGAAVTAEMSDAADQTTSAETETQENTAQENTGQEDTAQENTAQEETAAVSGLPAEKTVEYSMDKLMDFDYLLQNFYRVDTTTTIDSSRLNAQTMLDTDLTLSESTGNPQILIYHTHSQEGYADTVDASGTVMGVGEYLTQILTEQYGLNVLHHTGEYDLESRDDAYTKAAVGLEQVLAENPDIEVVIDLHRDGVPDTTRLVTEINGKQTAQIMFFNGLSQTTAGAIDYLPNENIATNLAFSFQMQLNAREYYPDFTRQIYLKGYRYNMHYCPKSLLVEVGAQTNTVEEAMNAMEPLAQILAKVLCK